MILLCSYSSFHYFKLAGGRNGKRVNGLLPEQSAIQKALEIVDNIGWV